MKMSEIGDEIMERMVTKQVIKENPELAKGFGCLSFLAFVFFSYSYCFLQ